MQLVGQDFDARLQHACEAHLQACWDAMCDDEAGEEGRSPASAPFCGCETCVVREVLCVAYPMIEEHLHDG